MILGDHVSAPAGFHHGYRFGNVGAPPKESVAFCKVISKFYIYRFRLCFVDSDCAAFTRRCAAVEFVCAEIPYGLAASPSHNELTRSRVPVD